MKFDDVKYEPLLSSGDYSEDSEVRNSKELSSRSSRYIFIIVVFIVTISFLIISKDLNLIRSSNSSKDTFLREYITRNQKPEYFLSSRLAVNARLGNHIFELISLYGISRTLNRTFIFWVENQKYSRMLDQVQRILPGLLDKISIVYAKVPPGFETTHFPDNRHTYLDPMVLENRKDTLLHLSGTHYQSWKYFSHYRGEILSFLRPPKNFTNLPESNSTHKITCIHIRRGDFIKNGRFTADQNFIRRALKAISPEPGNSSNQSIVLFGDDQNFMSSIFQVPHFISNNSPQDDLLYASQHCDTVLITAPSSTFGWWMGYLSKGNRVYYTDPNSVEGSLLKTHWIIPDDFFPHHWVPLKVE